MPVVVHHGRRFPVASLYGRDILEPYDIALPVGIDDLFGHLFLAVHKAGDMYRRTGIPGLELPA